MQPSPIAGGPTGSGRAPRPWARTSRARRTRSSCGSRRRAGRGRRSRGRRAARPCSRRSRRRAARPRRRRGPAARAHAAYSSRSAADAAVRSSGSRPAPPVTSRRTPGTAAAVGRRAQRGDERLGVRDGLVAQVEHALGALGHGVLRRAAADLADVDGDAARVVGELLRGVDELRERPDRVRAVLVVVAGVRGLAVRDDGHRADALAPRDDRVGRAPGLEHERARGAARELAAGAASSSASRPPRRRRDTTMTGSAASTPTSSSAASAPRITDEPALHVEHAGADRAAAVLAPALEVAGREHGVVVADEQDRRRPAAAVRHTR